MARKARWEFVIATVLTIVCGFLLVDSLDSKASKPHVWITGTLNEWALIRGRSPALRFRLQDETIDFRVGIEMFREGMSREIPPGFVQGARISALVQREQYAHPSTPLFDRDTRVVFVNGLRVDDKEIFGLSTQRAWEERNRIWGYALLVAAMAYAVYAGAKWRRLSK